MNRRSFITGRAASDSMVSWHASPALQRAIQPKALQQPGSTETYSGPWTRKQAAHLMRRAGFGASTAELQWVITQGMEATVDRLLDETFGSMLPAPMKNENDPQGANWDAEGADKDSGGPYTWTDDLIEPYTQERQQRYNRWNRDHKGWWLRNMNVASIGSNRANLPNPLREKITLFWHGLLVSDYTTVRIPQALWLQTSAYRERAFGSFKDLALYTVTDPAMVLYLNTNENIKNRPNENYARELLELFTMGEGNYTEEDIVELSRVFTGWQFRTRTTGDAVAVTVEFVPILHDYGPKDFMGERITSTVLDPDAGMEEAQRVIDIIFDRVFTASEVPVAPATEYIGKHVAAVYLADRLYREFVYALPDHATIVHLADTLVANNYDVRSVLRELFTMDHFYGEELFGAHIKSPVEYAVNLMHGIGMEMPLAGPGRLLAPIQYMVAVSDYLGQELLDPPNVAGWPGYRQWINTQTYPYRTLISAQAVRRRQANGGRFDEAIQFDIVEWAHGFESIADAEAFVNEVAETMLATPLHISQIEILYNELLLGAPSYEWENILESPQLQVRLENMLARLTEFPEYQLM